MRWHISKPSKNLNPELLKSGKRPWTGGAAMRYRESIPGQRGAASDGLNTYAVRASGACGAIAGSAVGILSAILVAAYEVLRVAAKVRLFQDLGITNLAKFLAFVFDTVTIVFGMVGGAYVAYLASKPTISAQVATLQSLVKEGNGLDHGHWPDPTAWKYFPKPSADGKSIVPNLD